MCLFENLSSTLICADSISFVFFDRATCHQSILILSAFKLHKRRRNIHTYICMNTVILIQLAIMKNLVFEQKKENKLYFTERHNFHNFLERTHWFEVLINVEMDFNTHRYTQKIHLRSNIRIPIYRYDLNTMKKSFRAMIYYGNNYSRFVFFEQYFVCFGSNLFFLKVIYLSIFSLLRIK